MSEIKKQSPTSKAGNQVQSDDPATLAANLYKQNVEISGKNKTLSLLSKLYEISILTLSPKDIAERVSHTVQTDLSLELVGIFLFNRDKDELQPLAFASSERLEKVQSQFGVAFGSINIPTKQVAFLHNVILSKSVGYSESLKEVWGSIVPHEMLNELSSQGHVKSTITHPLIIQSEVIGVLLLSLNRPQNDLVDYEKETISNFINVIAVALDKALLYEQVKIANEQLKALDKARAEFISIASHQLRTPPSTIKWYLNSVLAGDFGPLSEELKAALQRTNVTNEAQISTIDDLLNASRIERGKLEFFFEKNDLKPVVAALVEQLQPLAQMKKMNIVYRPPSEALPEIMMDKEKVRQIINNMIDNAIKYSKQGDIVVELKKDAEHLIVSVTDQGKGIAPEDVAKLFQKYSRGHDSVTHATGLGLGMYVAKVIVEQHHGKIWVESPGVGKGSTFLFSLPINSQVQATTVDLTKSA